MEGEAREPTRQAPEIQVVGNMEPLVDRISAQQAGRGGHAWVMGRSKFLYWLWRNVTNSLIAQGQQGSDGQYSALLFES